MTVEWDYGCVECPCCHKRIDGEEWGLGLDSDSWHEKVEVTCEACGCVFDTRADVEGTIEVYWGSAKVLKSGVMGDDRYPLPWKEQIALHESMILHGFQEFFKDEVL